VQKMHVARLKFPGPATEETWVTDGAGDPLLVVMAEPSSSLAAQIKELLPRLREIAGQDAQPTLCFDRGGWSPDLFADIIHAGFHLLTYRKNTAGTDIPGPPADKFSVVSHAGDDGRLREYELAESQVELTITKGERKGQTLPLRQVTRLDKGRQVHILTSRQAGDLPFDQRQFHASNAGRLARAEDSFDRRSLELVHLHVSAAHLAAQQRLQLHVRNQMKSASQIVASDDFRLPASRNSNALQNLPAMCCNRPTVGNKRNPRQFLLQLKPLSDLGGMEGQPDAEPRQAAPRRLLTEDWNLGALLAQICCDCQQQRARSGDDHTLATNRQSRLHRRLQAASSHDVRQSPSRKRQKPFPRSGCHHQIRIVQFADIVASLRQ